MFSSRCTSLACSINTNAPIFTVSIYESHRRVRERLTLMLAAAKATAASTGTPSQVGGMTIDSRIVACLLRKFAGMLIFSPA